MTGPSPKKLSTTNTKQEMLDAYNKLLESLESKKENEIKASEKIEEKQIKLALDFTDSLSNEAINKKMSELKYEFGLTLSKLNEKVEEEFAKYQSIKKAVLAKDSELTEIYEIQKSAESLNAMLEAQRIKKEEFTEEMDELKIELETEINDKRKKWDIEKTQKEIEIKEREKQELAIRNREKEEYLYKLQREQQVLRDKYENEKALLEKELSELKEKTEKDLAEREKNILENEAELKELRAKSAEFPKEIARVVDKSVKEATERIILDAKHKEELLISSFDGDKRVLNIKIDTLEQTIKEQNELISKYALQLDKAYSQIQDIATKAVEGSSNKPIPHFPQP